MFKFISKYSIVMQHLSFSMLIKDKNAIFKKLISKKYSIKPNSEKIKNTLR